MPPKPKKPTKKPAKPAYKYKRAGTSPISKLKPT